GDVVLKDVANEQRAVADDAAHRGEGGGEDGVGAGEGGEGFVQLGADMAAQDGVDLFENDGWSHAPQTRRPDEEPRGLADASCRFLHLLPARIDVDGPG